MGIGSQIARAKEEDLVSQLGKLKLQTSLFVLSGYKQNKKMYPYTLLAPFQTTETPSTLYPVYALSCMALFIIIYLRNAL